MTAPIGPPTFKAPEPRPYQSPELKKILKQIKKLDQAIQKMGNLFPLKNHELYYYQSLKRKKESLEDLAREMDPFVRREYAKKNMICYLTVKARGKELAYDKFGWPKLKDPICKVPYLKAANS